MDDDDHLFIYLVCGRKSPKKATLDSFICCKASDPSFSQFVNYINFFFFIKLVIGFKVLFKIFMILSILFFSKYDDKFDSQFNVKFNFNYVFYGVRNKEL